MDSTNEDLIAQFSGITGASPATVSLERTLPHIRHQSSVHTFDTFLSFLPVITFLRDINPGTNRSHCIRLEP